MKRSQGRKTRRLAGNRWFHGSRIEGLEDRRLLSTVFDVTNTNDTGAGSLRQAIIGASGSPGNSITFHVGSGGPQSILLNSPLPGLNTSVTLDATTQPGYQGKPLIELNGAQAGSTANGLTITAPSVVVRGLAINRFNGYGIALFNTGGDTIAGNYIGTDLTGEIALANSLSGIVLANAKANTIGGLAPNQGNVISDNGLDGITFFQGSSGNTVVGNFIGTDATGEQIGDNARNGLAIFDSRSNTIGGATTAARNVISGNDLNGIAIATLSFNSGAADGNTVQGNFIGTDATGASRLGNGSSGVEISSSFNVVGGTSVAQGNTIAFNGRTGVTVESSFGVTGFNGNLIASNSIHDNAQKGITLGYQANANQAPPRLTEAYNSTGRTTVEGSIFGAPSTSYQLQFFSNLTADPGGFGEGQTLLDTRTITTDSSGRADFAILLSQTVPADHTITATATGPGNNTSEFSNPVPIYPGPAADLAAFVTTSAPNVLVGGSLVYIATVLNFGPSNATKVVLTDTLPAGVTVVSAQSASGPCTVANGQVVCTVPSLDSGAQAQVSIIVKPAAPGVLNDSVSVTGAQFDTNLRNNKASVSTSVSTATFNLSVRQTAVPNPAVVLGAVTYTIDVTNFGPDPAPQTVLTDTLPAGVNLLSTSATTGTIASANGQVVASLGTIPAGDTETVTIVVAPNVTIAPTASSTITNVVIVQANGNETNPTDNTSTLGTTVLADFTPPTIVTQQIYANRSGISRIVLSFSKALDPTTAQEPINYTLRAPGPDHLFDTPDDQSVAIKSIVYDPTLRTVTITPKTPLKLAHFYRLAINGPGAPGVTDPSGNVLNGDQPYVSFISRGTHLRPNADPALLRLPQFNAGRRIAAPAAPGVHQAARPHLAGISLGRLVLVPGA